MSTFADRPHPGMCGTAAEWVARRTMEYVQAEAAAVEAMLAGSIMLADYDKIDRIFICHVVGNPRAGVASMLNPEDPLWPSANERHYP